MANDLHPALAEFDKSGSAGTVSPALADWDAKNPQRGIAAEVGTQLYAGATVDLPKMVGQAMQWFGEEGGDLAAAGKSVADWSERRARENPEFAPQTAGSGFVRQALSGGARAIVPSLASAIPALAAAPFGVPAALTAGGAGIVGLFGGSQAQDTYEEVRKAGGSEEDAKTAGYINMLIESGGEAIGTYAGAKLLGLLAKPVMKAGESGVQAAIRSATSTEVLAPWLKQLPKTALIESATEFGQGAGEAAVERAYGVQGKDPMAEGAHGALAAIGMTALLAPFGLAGFSARAKRNERVADALTNPEAPVPDRIAASKILFDEIAKVNPEAAKAWSQNAAVAISEQLPISLDEPKQIVPRETPQAGQAAPARPLDSVVADIVAAPTPEQAIGAAMQSVDDDLSRLVGTGMQGALSQGEAPGLVARARQVQAVDQWNAEQDAAMAGPPLPPAPGGPRTLEERLAIARMGAEARAEEDRKARELDKLQRSGQPAMQDAALEAEFARAQAAAATAPVEAPKTAMQIAMEQARAKAAPVAGAPDAVTPAQAAPQAGQQSLADAQIVDALNRLVSRRLLTETERDALVGMGYAKIGRDNAVTMTKAGFSARQRIMRAMQPASVSPVPASPNQESVAAPAAAPQRQAPDVTVIRAGEGWRVAGARNLNPISQTYPTQQEADAAAEEFKLTGNMPAPAPAPTSVAPPAPEFTAIGNGTYVAKANGREIARANVADDGAADYLTSIAVDEEYQRKGVGRGLWNFIEKDLGRQLRGSPRHETPAGRALREAIGRPAADTAAAPAPEANAEPVGKLGKQDAAEENQGVANPIAEIAQPNAQPAAPAVPDFRKSTDKALKLAAKTGNKEVKAAARAEIERREQEKADKASDRAAAASARMKERARLDVERDSLLPAIAKLGGLKASDRLDLIGDEKGNRLVPGVGPLFRTNGGKGLDELASRLNELGYLTDDEINDVDGGVGALRMKIRDEWDGVQTHLTPAGMAFAAAMDEKAREEARARMEAAPVEGQGKAAVDAAEMLAAEAVEAAMIHSLNIELADAVRAAYDEEEAGYNAVASIQETLEREHDEQLEADRAAAGIQPRDNGGAQRAAAGAAQGGGEGGARGGIEGDRGGVPEAGRPEEVGDRPALELAAQTPEEARAEAERLAEIARKEAADRAAAAAKERREANKAEKDRRAAQVIAERQAAKKAEVDAARDAFALGQQAPAPVDRKVDDAAAAGQRDVFGDAQPPTPANPIAAAADALIQAAEAMKAAVENPEARNASPVAESQAPAPPEPGDRGVAPARDGVAPEPEETPVDATPAGTGRTVETVEEYPGYRGNRLTVQHNKAAGTWGAINFTREGTTTGQWWRGENAEKNARERFAAQVANDKEYQQADAESKRKATADLTRTYTVAEHDQVMERMRNGTLTAEELKAAFQRARASREAMTAELQKMTKDQLLKITGPMYRSDKKDRIVAGAYRGYVQDFAMGEGVSYGMTGPNAYEEAVERLVNATTDQAIVAYSERVKAAREERAQRLQSIMEGVKDPQTIEDFERFLSVKKQSDLTPEQLRRFDDLMAAKGRERRQAEQQQRARVETAGQAVGASIVETKHTKKGHDLFVVQLETRVERDDYNRLNSAAKRLGGYYSSFRGAGAVQGFQFTTRANAEAFQKLAAGDATAATAAVQERRAGNREAKKNAAAERLAEMADRMEESAQERLGSDRLTNTARRARMADSAEAQARADESMAKTLRAISDAIESGKATNLDGIRTRKQVEELESILRRATYAAIRAADQNFEKKRDRPPSEADIQFAEYPHYRGARSDFAATARQVVGIPGAKMAGERLLKLTDDTKDYAKDLSANPLLLGKVMLGKRAAGETVASESALFKSKSEAEAAVRRSGMRHSAMVVPIAKRGMYAVVLGPAEAKGRGLWSPKEDPRLTIPASLMEEILDKVATHNSGKPSQDQIRVGWYFDSVRESRKRLASMGVMNAPELRAALREYLDLRSQERKPDRVKELERALAGRADVGFDFFPTPAPLAARMAEALELKPGMLVLEPSAGKGNLADAVRDAEPGAQVDVIEQSGTLREILDAKGYSIVGNDFNNFDPRDFTYGDVFRAPDGRLGVMRGSGGMGSGRVGFQPIDKDGNPDARNFTYENREDLVGVEKRGDGSGYDRIIMNPPFSNGIDADHIQRAYTMLKPGGRLVAISGEGIFSRNDAKAQAFREWFDSVGGTAEEMEDAFTDRREVKTTSVRSRLLVIDKPDDTAAPPMYSRTPGISYENPTPIPNGIIPNLVRYDVRDRDGRMVGAVAMAMLDGRPSALADINIDAGSRNGGIGRRVVADLVRQAGADGLYIVNIQPEAVGFWQRMGVVLDEGEAWVHGNGVLTAQAVAQALGQTESGTGADQEGERRVRQAEGEDEPPALRRPDPETTRAAADAGLSVSALRAFVEAISANWANAPRVTVLDRPEDSGVADVDPTAWGMYHGGQVYLFAGNIPTLADAQFVLLHEIMGHAGLRGLLGDELGPVLRELAAANPALRVEAAAWMARYGKQEIASRVASGMSRAEAEVYVRLAAIEEALADRAGKGLKITGLQRFVAAIQRLLRKAGLDAVADWMEGATQAETASMLASARKFVEGDPSPFTAAQAARFGLASRGSAGPVWYSELARQVAALQQASASPMMWKATIAGLTKKGVKPDEIEWSGINEWLAMQQGPKVTRDQVLEYLRNNGVQVTETVLGMEGGEQAESPESVRVELDALGYNIETDWSAANGEPIPVAIVRREGGETYDITPTQEYAEDSEEKAYLPITDLPEEVRALAQRLIDATEAEFDQPDHATKFSHYTLPGGENYRELLLTLPTPEAKRKALSNWRVERFGEDTGADYEGWNVRADMANGEIFRSEIGIEDAATPEEAIELARRVADRHPMTDVDTAKFRSGHFDQPNVLAHIRFDERTDADGRRVLFIQEIQSDWAQKGRREGFRPSETEAAAIRAEYDAAAQAVQDAHNDDRSKLDAARERFAAATEAYNARINDASVPTAPFVTKTDAWVALAMKRMIRYAAENGFDRIAWTTGEQQGDRYDLSKQVDAVYYVPLPGGEFSLWADAVGTGRRVEIGAHPAARLPDVVGKDLADKIVAGAGELVPNQGETRKLAGLDLKVGGEGMIAFYDRIVPKVARDVLKKLGGGQVGEIKVGMGEVMDHTSKFGTRKIEKPQPGFDITPEMRAKAMEGMPLFARGAPVRFRHTIAQMIEHANEVSGWRDWYDRFAAQLDEMFGGDAALFRRFLSATSQRQTVGGNVTAALKAYKQYIRGEPFTGYLSPVIRNLQRAVLEENLAGPKIGQFDAANAGDKAAVAIDRHVAEYLFGTKDPRARHHAKGWRRLALLAESIGWEPREVQAALWAYNQIRKGKTPGSFDVYLNHKRSLVAELRAERQGAAGPGNAARRGTGRARAGRAGGSAGRAVGSREGNAGRGKVGRDTRYSRGTSNRDVGADQTQTAAFRAWFGESKVVDAEGRPLVVYHGTDREFTTFDAASRPSWNSGNDGYYGKGFYATAEKWRAEDFGKNVMPLFVSLQNPYTIDGYDPVKTATDLLQLKGLDEQQRRKLQQVADGQFEEELGLTVNALSYALNDRARVGDVDDYGAKLTALLQRNGFDGVIAVNADASATTEYVAFRPTQLKSATGNRGTFDPTNPDIRYSRGPSVVGQAGEIAQDILRSDAKFNLWHRTVGTGQHKAKLNNEYRAVYDEVQGFIADTSRYSNEAADLAQDLLPRIESLADFKRKAPSKDDIRAVADALMEGTLYGGGSPMDGKVWTDDELQGVEQFGRPLPTAFKLTDFQIKLYRQARAAVDKSLDEVGKALLWRLARTHGMDVDRDMSLEDIAEDARMRMRKMADEHRSNAEMAEEAHEEELANYTESLDDGRPQSEVRRLIQKFKDDHRRYVAGETRAADELDAAVKAVDDIEGKVNGLKEHGYYPAMRFGRYYVRVDEKQPDMPAEQVYFGMYESQFAANRAARQLAKDYPGALVSRGIVAQDTYKLYQGLSLDAVETFAEHMTDEEGRPLRENPVVQQFLRAAVNERSILKRHINRKGIEGYSTDIPRTLSSFVLTSSRSAAGHYHLGEAAKLAAGIRDGDVQKEAADLVTYIKNPQEEAAAVRGLLFATFLGGSIASAITNLTQPLMVTAPWMTQHTSYADAAAKITTAVRDYWRRGSLSGELGEAFRRAEREGIVSPQEIHQLRAEAEGSAVSSSLAWRKITHAWGFFFQSAEQLNRGTTFIAAYRLAQQNKRLGDPYAFARTAVEETQFVYNKGCVDEATECLTLQGWKSRADLTVGETVYAVNAGGELVESTLEDVHVYSGKQTAIEFVNSNGLSMVLTPEHKCLVQNYSSRDRKYQKPRLVRADSIKRCNQFVRVPLGDATGRVPVYSDDEVRLFAWVAAEGNYAKFRNCKNKTNVRIAQSIKHNPHYVDEIESLLIRLGGHYRKFTVRSGEMATFTLKKPLSDVVRKVLPNKLVQFDLLSKLTPAQMGIFIDTFVKGDGHIAEEGGRVISQKDVGNLNVLQAMAVLSGQSSTKYDRIGQHDFGALYVAKNSKRAQRSAMEAKEITVNTVWCPQTSHGTWIARRNGRTFVTGNSRPRFGRGPIGATVMTFKTFSISYLELAKRLYDLRNPDGSRNLKPFGIMLLTLFVMAGLEGLPFAEDAEDLIDTIGQWLGYGTNSKKKLRQLAASAIGPDAAQILLHGVSGIPGVPLDVSGRLGMHNLIPGTAALKPSEKNKARDVLEILGPAGQFLPVEGAKVGEALKAAAKGDFFGQRSAMSELSPVAVQNLLTGIEMASTGQYKDREGRLVRSVTASEGVIKAIGFNPRAVADESRLIREQRQDVEIVRQREDAIADRWARGILEQQPGEVQAARDDLAAWNRDNPTMPIKITMSQIASRVRQARMSRSDRFARSAPPEMRGQVRAGMLPP